MNKLTKFALMFLCGAFALGFSSCSDDDDNNSSTSDNDRSAIPATTFSSSLSSYVNDIVYTNYKDLQEAAVTLKDACANLNKKKKANEQLTQDDIDAACAAFKVARRYWEQSEAFLYGPATEDAIDPHMDSWPLDQSQMADALVADTVKTGLEGENAAQYVYTHNQYFDSTLGFHGLEFILFRNGANRTAEAFNKEYEDGDGLNRLSSDNSENRTKLQSVTTKEEAAFAAAVSEDLRNMTKLLEYEWDGNAALKDSINTNSSWIWASSQYTDASTHDFTTNMSYGATINGVNRTNGYLFDSYQANFSNILLAGCQNICQEVHTQKLGQAYRIATGDMSGHEEDGKVEADAADYIESPYSHRSFQDYQDNIYGIRNVLYGKRGSRDAANSDSESTETPADNSIMAILLQYYPEAASLQSALTNALASFDTAKAGPAFIEDPDNANVKNCMDAVEALDTELQNAATWLTMNVDVLNN